MDDLQDYTIDGVSYNVPHAIGQGKQEFVNEHAAVNKTVTAEKAGEHFEAITKAYEAKKVEVSQQKAAAAKEKAAQQAAQSKLSGGQAKAPASTGEGAPAASAPAK